LGNHDFYHGSIKEVRRMISRFSYETKRLIYLSNAPVLELTPTTAVIGHDGWGDGRFGDFNGSSVILNDYVLIKELCCLKSDDTLDKPKLRKIIEKLGDEAAEHLDHVLLPAVNKYEEVVVVTHVPPFQESAWYEGKQSTSDFMPFFSCKATGEVLLGAAKLNPKCNIKVLCGHTHGNGTAQILDNLKVFTAGAVYKRPVIQRIFLI
jgi:predicted phosphohydrolase